MGRTPPWRIMPLLYSHEWKCKNAGLGVTRFGPYRIGSDRIESVGKFHDDSLDRMVNRAVNVSVPGPSNEYTSRLSIVADCMHVCRTSCTCITTPLLTPTGSSGPCDISFQPSRFQFLALDRRLDLPWWHTQSISIPVEQHSLVFTLGAFAWFYPLAPPRVLPHALHKSHGSIRGIRAIMTTQDRFDCLGRFIGMVEWNGRDKVMENVGFNDPMEKMAANETKFTVNRCGGATGECPSTGFVMRQRRIGMLKEGNSHW